MATRRCNRHDGGGEPAHLWLQMRVATETIIVTINAAYVAAMGAEKTITGQEAMIPCCSH